MGNCIQASGQVLSGRVVFWIFLGLPFTHLYPSRSFVRRIWNLVVPVHTSESLTPFASVHISLIIFFIDTDYTRLSLSHYGDVLQRDRECFILWVVKLQTRFFMMSMKKIPLVDHESSVFSPLFVAFFFDFDIIFRLEFSLCWQWRSWTMRKSQNSVCTRKIVLLFYENFLFFESFHVIFRGIWFLQIFIICYDQVSWPTSSRTWRIALECSSQRFLS